SKVVLRILRPDLSLARDQWLSSATSPEERARRDESDFLRYKDRNGLFADFHSLRHSFITLVGRNGVHFKTTQDLARHSSPTLTARYTHGFRADEIAAIEALPDLSTKATLDGVSRNSALYSAFESAEPCSSAPLDAEFGDSALESHSERKLWPREALRGGEGTCGEKKLEAAPGFEPG